MKSKVKFRLVSAAVAAGLGLSILSGGAAEAAPKAPAAVVSAPIVDERAVVPKPASLPSTTAGYFYSSWSSPVLCQFASGHWTPVQWRLEYLDTYPTQRHIYQIRVGNAIPGWDNDEWLTYIQTREYSNGVPLGHLFQYPSTATPGWQVLGYTSPAFGTYYMPFVSNSTNLRIWIRLYRNDGNTCTVY